VRPEDAYISRSLSPHCFDHLPLFVKTLSKFLMQCTVYFLGLPYLSNFILTSTLKRNVSLSSPSPNISSNTEKYQTSLPVSFRRRWVRDDRLDLGSPVAKTTEYM
jgi:hypothetical protein